LIGRLSSKAEKLGGFRGWDKELVSPAVLRHFLGILRAGG